MSKHISCSPVNIEKLLICQKCVFAAPWTSSKSEARAALNLMQAVHCRQILSELEKCLLTCISPAMSLPRWLQWQVWNNREQKRHGTQQWRDSHPSGRSLWNTASGQLKGSKQTTSDNWCASLWVSRKLHHSDKENKDLRTSYEHCCGKICAFRSIPHNPWHRRSSNEVCEYQASPAHKHLCLAGKYIF